MVPPPSPLPRASSFNISIDVLRTFLSACRRAYSSKNPYHNFVHGPQGEAKALSQEGLGVTCMWRACAVSEFCVQPAGSSWAWRHSLVS